MRMKVVILVIGALLAAASLSALTMDELDVNLGLIHIGTTDPAAQGPSIITPLFGVSLPLGLGGPFFLEPMLEFYTTYYLWTGTAVAPAALETGGNAFLALGTLISLHGGLRYAVSPAITLGGSVGVDFLLRFPIEFLSNDPNRSADTGSALSYFFGMARFFYPETRLFLKWQLTNPVGLVVSLRAWYPLFHLWDGQNLPFLDQFMFSGGIGIAIRLGPAPAAPASAPSAEALTTTPTTALPSTPAPATR